MDPVSLLIAALTAGAVKAVEDGTGGAVSDAYHALTRLIGRRVGGNQPAEVALEQHRKDPVTWEKPLAKALQEGDLGRDAEVVALAQRILTLADPEGSVSGKYTLDLKGAQVGSIGDNNSVAANFSASPQQR